MTDRERKRAEYLEFFKELTGHAPYPYQEDLGLDPWPDLLDVPTGLGKTAALVVAWLWKRLHSDPETPRRLVYCLPMRVLVEQTERNATAWAKGSEKQFLDAGLEVPTVSTLMGGDVDLAWIKAERPAILVGTQDMLLSRALNRGYGMSPFQWAVHFGLLHNDAFWVFDEVQLMGPAVATSAQLEAFRRSLETAKVCRSLWASATLAPGWLATIDLEDHARAFRTAGLTSRDHALDRVARLIGARKRVERSRARLDKDSSKKGAASYLESLAREILDRRLPGTNTLVILNRVDRAQGLFRKLRPAAGDDGFELRLIHSRFRPAERKRLEAQLRDEPGPAGRVIVSTQVVEAGVDLSSATLFTELCPWASFVQRCGRCNRRGEHVEAQVLWIDLEEGEGDLALPYEGKALAAARAELDRLDDAGSTRLPQVEAEPLGGLVLRRRDLLELYNTDPDLSGFHVDVSPFIRDSDERNLQVFWREVPREGPPPDFDAAVRDELCTISIAAGRRALEKRKAWTWDAQVGKWLAVRRDDLRPGMTILLASTEGGYDVDLGFAPEVRTPVKPVSSAAALGAPEAAGSDKRSQGRRWVRLPDHLRHVTDSVEGLTAGLDLPPEERLALRTAARWHDAGKVHPVFQMDLLRKLPPDDPKRAEHWAKSGEVTPRVDPQGETGPRPEPLPPRSATEVARRRYFRHELASAILWLAHHRGEPGADLVAYLIAAHHGKVRMGLRALPAEPAPDGSTGRLYARGVWNGDSLPRVELPGEEVPETELSLEIMELGEGPWGPSWTARTRRLLAELGPFRLAWLETLIRLADWRASDAEQAQEES